MLMPSFWESNGINVLSVYLYIRFQKFIDPKERIIVKNGAKSLIIFNTKCFYGSLKIFWMDLCVWCCYRIYRNFIPFSNDRRCNFRIIGQQTKCKFVGFFSFIVR